jgi:rare lipoprotein A
MYQMTAAHRILPMHTRVVVRNLDNGRTAEVRVNDRGPFVNNRVIDLSYAAANHARGDRPGHGPGQFGDRRRERIQYVGPFYVQYGAFVVEENAKRLKGASCGAGALPGTRIAKGELDGTTFTGGCRSGLSPAWQKPNRCGSRLAKESPGCFRYCGLSSARSLREMRKTTTLRSDRMMDSLVCGLRPLRASFS